MIKRTRLLALVGLLALAAACSRDAPFSVLYPKGPIAKRADELWDHTFGIAVVVFFLVEGALVYILYRYRRRRRDEAPEQSHGNTKLEIIWTVVPALLLAVIAVPTVSGILFLSKTPPDSLKIDVIGHQWWWEFRYPGGVTTANELHIPTDRDITLNLRSVDVIHSFWIPKLAGKQDVVPGRINPLQLRADSEGTYEGQCAEYCGLSHANMRVRVFAESEDRFEDWLTLQGQPAAVPAEPLALEGRDLFVNGPCAGCHTVKGTSASATVGPDLTHLAGRTSFAANHLTLTSANLSAWLRDPPKVKPGSKMPDLNLAEDDIEALVAYLLTLE